MHLRVIDFENAAPELGKFTAVRGCLHEAWEMPKELCEQLVRQQNGDIRRLLTQQRLSRILARDTFDEEWWGYHHIHVSKEAPRQVPLTILCMATAAPNSGERDDARVRGAI